MRDCRSPRMTWDLGHPLRVFLVLNVRWPANCNSFWWIAAVARVDVIISNVEGADMELPRVLHCPVGIV